jgi:prenyltransferase beta subunit
LGESVPDSAVSALRARAQTGGGWEWQPGFGVDTNTTALAIRALLAAGEPVNAPAIRAGIAFLRQAQNADGGFPYTPAEAPEPSSPSDANSTAYVVQALYAAGQDPASRCWASRSQTPLDYLRARQLLDGSFEWQPGLGADSLATQQAIPALLGATYPTVAGRVQACTLVFAPFVSP